MYLIDVGQTLRRRWYLLVAVLLLSAAATLSIVSRMPATYRTDASIVLVPPQTTLGDTGNPYLFLGGLEQSVDVLSRDLSSEQVAHAMKLAGGSDASYIVAADNTTSAPIVLVTTEGPTAAAADAMLNAVVAQVPVSLQRLQADLSVRGSAQITTQLISRKDRPEEVMSGRYRSIVVIGGALVVAGVFLLAAFDGLLQRRRLRRRRTVQNTAPVRRFDEGSRESSATVPSDAAVLGKRSKTGTDG